MQPVDPTPPAAFRRRFKSAPPNVTIFCGTTLSNPRVFAPINLNPNPNLNPYPNDKPLQETAHVGGTSFAAPLVAGKAAAMVSHMWDINLYKLESLLHKNCLRDDEAGRCRRMHPPTAEEQEHMCKEASERIVDEHLHRMASTRFHIMMGDPTTTVTDLDNSMRMPDQCMKCRDMVQLTSGLPVCHPLLRTCVCEPFQVFRRGVCDWQNSRPWVVSTFEQGRLTVVVSPKVDKYV